MHRFQTTGTILVIMTPQMTELMRPNKFILSLNYQLWKMQNDYTVRRNGMVALFLRSECYMFISVGLRETGKGSLMV